VGRDLGGGGSTPLGLVEVILNLLAAGTGGFEIGGQIAADLRLAAGPTLDVVTQRREARGQFRAIHGGPVLLRLVEFLRLECARLAGAPLGHVEEHDVRVQLGRGVPVDGSGAVVLKAGSSPLPRRLRGMIPADPRLNVPFRFVQCHPDTRPMRFGHAHIAADECGQGHTLGGGEGPIPARAVRHGLDSIAVLVGVSPGGLVVDERPARDRVLAVGEPMDVRLLHVTNESPLPRELAVPLPANLVTLGVIVVTALLNSYAWYVRIWAALRGFEIVSIVTSPTRRSARATGPRFAAAMREGRRPPWSTGPPPSGPSRQAR
jgi:hypothetical protein